MINKKITDSFWEAIPEGATWDDLADGITVSFQYEGKKYSVNTRVQFARTMSMDGYRNIIEGRAIDAVKRGGN